MSREPLSGYDAFTVQTTFAWLRACIRDKLLTKEDVVNALAFIDDENIIPFPGPRLAVDNTINPPNQSITIVFWRDTREDDNDKNNRRRNWIVEDAFSTEEAAIRFIKDQEGKEYRIAWGYRTLLLDKPRRK